MCRTIYHLVDAVFQYQKKLKLLYQKTVLFLLKSDFSMMIETFFAQLFTSNSGKGIMWRYTIIW